MQKSKTRLSIFTSLLISLCLGFSACAAKKNAETIQLESGIPAELSESKLVFETVQGIHLQTPGKPSELLVAKGKWPRWRADGGAVSFLKGNDVCVINLASREIQVLAETQTPKTLVFSADGSEVWFSDGKTAKAVNVANMEQRILAEDGEFLEMDSGPGGMTLVATVKSFGYKVKLFDLESGENRSLGKGCSASLSPDGKFATNNLDGHKELAIAKVSDGSREKTLPAPGEMLTDNQFWSNRQEWIMSMEEEGGQLLVHRLSDGKVWKLSDITGADRPDLWVP